MFLFATGALAGVSHVLTGPDHLAAVAPLAARDRSSAVRTGAWWGLGHGLAVLALVLVGRVLLGGLDLSAVSHWAELAVGVALIGMGLYVGASELRGGPTASHHHNGPASFGIGALHGAGGGGHLLAVLPALALSAGHAAVYLAAYLSAAILAMVGFTLLIGAVTKGLGQRLLRGTVLGSAGLSIGVGIVWIGLMLG